MDPPPPHLLRKHGGRRPNAGRKKLTTPVKRAIKLRRNAQKNISRAYAHGKFVKTEMKLEKLYKRGLQETDGYRALAFQYIKLAKFLNYRHAKLLQSGTLPEMEEETPEMDTIDIDQFSASSDEVFTFCKCISSAKNS